MTNRCTAKTAAGKRCTARPIRGGRLCWLHVPGNAERTGSLGGRRRRLFAPEKLEQFQPPASAKELEKILATALIELRAGRLDPRIASTLGYVGSAFLKAAELGSLEERLARLERGQDELRQLSQSP